MAKFKFSSVLVINDQEFFLTKEEIIDCKVMDISWPDKTCPPYVVYRIIEKTIKEKYKDQLDRYNTSRLTSLILNSSNQESGKLFWEQRKYSEEGFYSGKYSNKLEMEQDRLDLQAKMHTVIPRSEYEDHYINERKKKQNR